MKTYGRRIVVKIPGVIDHNSGKKDYARIDEEIVEAIKIINKKGYLTICSCAGHFGKRSTVNGCGYIWFALFPEYPLPRGFERTTAGGDNSLRWECKSISSLKKAQADLLKWAKALPERINLLK